MARGVYQQAANGLSGPGTGTRQGGTDSGTQCIRRQFPMAVSSRGDDRSQWKRPQNPVEAIVECSGICQKSSGSDDSFQWKQRQNAVDRTVPSSEFSADVASPDLDSEVAITARESRPSRLAPAAADTYLKARARGPLPLAWRCGCFRVALEGGEIEVRGMISPPLGYFQGNGEGPNRKMPRTLVHLPRRQVIATLRTARQCRELGAELAPAYARDEASAVGITSRHQMESVYRQGGAFAGKTLQPAGVFRCSANSATILRTK